MDKVWILSLGMDYEGEEVLGVFDTEAGAHAAAARYVAKQSKYEEWAKRTDLRWAYRSSYQYLHIEAFTVTREP